MAGDGLARPASGLQLVPYVLDAPWLSLTKGRKVQQGNRAVDASLSNYPCISTTAGPVGLEGRGEVNP